MRPPEFDTMFTGLELLSSDLMALRNRAGDIDDRLMVVESNLGLNSVSYNRTVRARLDSLENETRLVKTALETLSERIYPTRPQLECNLCFARVPGNYQGQCPACHNGSFSTVAVADDKSQPPPRQNHEET